MSGQRLVFAGVFAVVGILIVAALGLFLNLPDAGAFDARVERIFVENADLTTPRDIRLLEILAQSGTAFADVLASYRMVIFVLLVSSTALLVAALTFLVLMVNQNRRMTEIERQGIRVASLVINRGENAVQLNGLDFRLTTAALETLTVLAEARMDDDILSGAEIEATISGRASSECEESAGATRIKRLRDALGNQIVAELLVKTVARRGYMLAVDRRTIRVE
jgi:DNA-binding winged helix-turn-helix (wHTH) protein